jgi:ech hydrogenase subunit B
MSAVEFFLILFAPVFGGLLYGLERKVKARMQNRVGPPLLQPFYDMFKLIDKQSFIIHPLHAILGILHFVSLWAVVAFMIVGANFLYVIFLHLLASLFLVAAGFSVKSVYSHIGANRELLALLAYEPIFILAASGFYMLNGSFDIEIIRQNSPALLPLILLFIALLMCVPLKLKKSPFDAPEAHQEIVGGVEIEYSGVFYEFIYGAKWLEYVFVYLLVILFAGNSLLLALVIFVLLFITVNLIDNATVRFRIKDTVTLILSIGLLLGMINLAGLSYVY